jgi:N-acetylglutamate synthase-like GNAT family acetyltransferase
VVFGVYRDGSQIGFARVLTDTARVAYLADVFIAENERSTGLGKRLVQFCMSHPDVVGCERVFLGTRDAQTLYQKFGFVAFPEDRVMLRDLRQLPAAVVE